MLIDRSHRRWIVSCSLIAVASGVVYMIVASDPLRPVSGGSASGLGFGIAGTACMLFAAALTLRKKLKNWWLGRASRWMAGHLWLGVLSLPLILFHGGFRFGGTLTTILMLLFFVSWASGVVGLVLQQVMPRRMTEQVQRETIFEQLDAVIARLAGRAKEVIAAATAPPKPVVVKPAVVAAAATPATAAAPSAAAIAVAATPTPALPTPAPTVPVPTPPAGATPAAVPPAADFGPLVTLYDEQIAPYLMPAARRSALFDDPAATALRRMHLERVLAPSLHPAVAELFELCEERRQLARQRSLHLWLHGWLFVHVPVSWALIAGAAFHAVRALRF